MTDEEINKFVSRLIKSLATKEDLKSLATKEDLKSLATKEDLKRVEGKIEELDEKTDIILEFAEAVDETTTDHEKRLRRIESVPA